MRLRRQLVVVAILLCTSFPFALAEKVADIQPTGYVIDLANVIQPEAKAKISAMATELQQKTGAQMAVVTVNSLEGETGSNTPSICTSISASVRRRPTKACCCWWLPRSGSTRLRLAMDWSRSSTMRAPATLAARWCRALRAGDYSAAILTAMTQIAQFIAADKGVQLTGVPNRRACSGASQKLPWWLIFLGIFIVFQIIRALIRRGGGGGPGSGLRSRGMGVPPVIFMPAMGGGWGRGGGLAAARVALAVVEAADLAASAAA